MVRHQAVAQDRGAPMFGMLNNQGKIDQSVIVGFEHEPACIAALRNVVGHFQCLDPEQSSHR